MPSVGSAVVELGADVGPVGFGDGAQLGDERGDVGPGQAVEDAAAVATGADEPGVAKPLQVRRRRRDVQPGDAGQFDDGSFALGEQLEHLQPGSAAQRLADSGHGVVQIAR